MERISEITDGLKDISEAVKKTFGEFTPDQLNWRPSAEKWSVAQCFEHLITINSTYFKTLDRIAEGKQETTTWQKISPLSGFFGKQLIKYLSPESVKKLKAPAKAQPSKSNIDAGIIEKFVGHQAELIERIKKIPAEVNTEKLIITSPLAKFVTYSLADAFKIIEVHERRHFQQAERVLQSEGFPNG